MRSADSAGRPFAGRAFEAGPFAADDGSAPAAFLEAHAAFTAGSAGPDRVVDALRDIRLLVPLLADHGRTGAPEGRPAADGAVSARRSTHAELALVTVAGPDGRHVLPAFASAAAMARWNPAARPVPAPARQVALGAAADGTELVIVDPGSPTRFGLRRSALEALARGRAWTPPWRDPAVLAALAAPAHREAAVTGVEIGTGDPAGTLEGAETAVLLRVRGALGPEGLQDLLARVQGAWTADPVVRDRVDSLAVRIAAG